MRLSEYYYSQSRYEQEKRNACGRLLNRPRYARAFEPGCGYGHLSHVLADRCGDLLVWECDEATRERAGQLLAPHGNIRVERAKVPAQWPSGCFNLIVLCEFLYYLTPPDVARVARRAGSSLAADGQLLACHWRHPIPEGDLVGDDVHHIVNQCAGLTKTREHRRRDYVLTLWQREASA